MQDLTDDTIPGCHVSLCDGETSSASASCEICVSMNRGTCIMMDGAGEIKSNFNSASKNKMLEFFVKKKKNKMRELKHFLNFHLKLCPSNAMKSGN